MTRKLFAPTAWFETSFRDYEHLSEQFKKWEFNVYDVADASKQRPLTYVLYELLKKYDLLTTFKVRYNLDVANIYWEHFCGFDDRSDLSQNKQKCHQHLKSGFKIYIIAVADPVIHGSKKAFSSIFL